MIQTAKRDSNEPRAGLSFLDGISKPTPQNLGPKDARFNVVKGESLSKLENLRIPPRQLFQILGSEERMKCFSRFVLSIWNFNHCPPLVEGEAATKEKIK
jgi:hypothetical protein